MPSESSPLDRLRLLALGRRSGELICASPSGEVHVYLQGGRIAWATDSAHAFVFGSHLQATAGIDAETFRHVVEECRRSRLSLGETMVAWGLASWDLVREALRRQVELAIELLSSAGAESAQVLFLERAYRTYDDKLTFGIDELLGATCEPAPKRQPREASIPPPGEPDLPEYARGLRSSVEGLSWVEVRDGDRVIDGDPPSEVGRVPPALVQCTTLDGADFVALRVARQSIVGVGLPRRRSVWALLSADSPFGGAVSALSALLPPRRRDDEAPLRTGGAIAWRIGALGEATAGVLAEFLGRAQEVLAALVLDADSSAVVAGSGCKAVDADDCFAIASRRRSILDVECLPSSAAADVASMGFYLRTAVSGESSVWCFGAQLAHPSGRSLWMFLDRKESQGLGWACLSALSRALAQNAGSASESR